MLRCAALPARALLAATLVLVPATAQLAPGDIGVVGFGDTTMVVVSGGTTVTTYPISGLGVLTGGGTAGGITSDPITPNSFIVAGDLGIGRVTITGPSAATTTVLVNHPPGSTSHLAKWMPSGMLVFAYVSAPGLYSLDPLSGIVQPIPITNPPWIYVGSVVADAQTGDLFVGDGNCCPGGQSLYRVSGASLTQIATSLGGSVSAMTQDLATGDLYATIWGANRVVKITQSGSVIDVIPTGTITSPDGISLDVNGDLLVLSRFAATVYRIPFGGSTAPPQVVLSGFNQPTELAVAGVASPPVSAFALSVVAPSDGSLTLSFANVPLSTFEGWTLFTTSIPTPLGQGPVFGIVPDAATFSIITGFPFPAIGNLFHWLPGWPGFFPDVPLALPSGSTAPLSGQTWDFLGVALDTIGQVAGATAPRRVVFP